MSNDNKQYSHNPTVSVLDAPIFPLYLPEDEDPVVITQAGIDLAQALRERFGYEVISRDEPKTKEPDPEPAIGFLDEAASAMRQRAALRDTPKGERTAGKIAKVFNAITGHELTESDAWLFLLVLKIVRSRSGKYSRDDFVDMAAYSALLGEHESTIPK